MRIAILVMMIIIKRWIKLGAIVTRNKNIKDDDVVSQPDSVNVPMQDIKKAGEAVENVIDEVIEPPKTVKELTKVFDKKAN